MAEFKIEIAGQVAAVTSMFESTRDYCRCYLSQKEPDFSVTVFPEDLTFEQDMADEEARVEGFKRRKFTDPFLERTAIQRKIAERLFDNDVLVFHGSTIAVDGEGFLFTAKSGTGKSTHTRFWRETFGDRAVMVNDDKPFLKIEQGRILACGSPWSGKHGLDTNVTVPLRGICILERGTENVIRRAEPREVIFMLLQQSNRPLNPEKMGKYMDLVDAVSGNVPLWHMNCNLDPDAARVAWEGMTGKKL